MSTQTEQSGLGLDDWLCLALYNASRAMTARYRPLLAEVGLTYPQLLVMTVLWEHEPVTVGVIGERLRLDSGTVSPLLRRLEQSGLVQRSRSEDDERQTLVTTTEAGRRLQARTGHINPTMCEATGLSDAESLALVEQLRALVRRLDG